MKAWRQLIGRETREESIEGNTAASSAVTPPIPQSLPQPERQPISQPPSKKIFPSGIKLLHDSGKSVIDIIFVHGLTGDREETWKAENAFDSWPKTLLPSKVADARVLTFGYDAYVANWRGMVSENRIGNHAMNLLTAIATHREDNDTNTRPIIFVCHSLGGLVCEDALVIAQQRPEKHLRQVLNCTRGILFIGTPHHGSGLAHWAESLAKSIGLLKQTNPEILNVLRRESEVLERVQGGFHTMLRTRAQEGSLPIEMTCFYEELPLPGVGLVVPKDSAILPGNISIGIRSNHMEMTKFDDLNHPGFISVAGELRRWSKAIAAAQLPQTSNVNASTSLQGPPQDLNGALPPALTTGFYKGIDISS
ncbi:hypothetical protein P154DRAFT_445974 [Amniculicola lignicola CBS 123094]|uniref:DUF676 domain-containing protein n=1 Tax=Amniculicola lignicola CBS 123094 TaxID=1392246 RepID=A0A6A5W0K3_9PLEO|nr:hypothetical protein P154DRAFT_445974 [Amniculicola lignicola CBS 123094]